MRHPRKHHQRTNVGFSSPPNLPIGMSKEQSMALSSEQQNDIAAELRRFSTDLNLAEDQKVKLRAALTEARLRVAEHLKANPNASRADVISKVAANREAIRQRLADFLSPEQLAKWDAIVTKAKEFLGQRLVA